MSVENMFLMLSVIDMFGSEGKLARAIGYTQHAVWRAKITGRVEPRMATAIEAATDGKIKRIEFCPDVFGPATVCKPRKIGKRKPR